MYYSNFVASKLNVWNSNGRHRLEEFLAKMGFSLEQCKQKYPFMSCQLRKRLRDQIEKYAEDYGLQDVFYGKCCLLVATKVDIHGHRLLNWSKPQLTYWVFNVIAGTQHLGSMHAKCGAMTRVPRVAGGRGYVDALLSVTAVHRFAAMSDQRLRTFLLQDHTKGIVGSRTR